MSDHHDYDWVTDDMFDSALESIVDAMSAAEILRITDVYEVLREELNNDVLSVLEQQRDSEQPGEDGTGGQDRESYTDDQDRESYTVGGGGD
jgi:hypothetical protein